MHHNEPLFAPKKIRAAYASWLPRFNFTQFLTVPFCPSKNFGSYFTDPWALQSVPRYVELTKRFLTNLGHKVFQRGPCRGRDLYYYGSSETLTRNGDPTPFHFHILLDVPPDYESAIYKYYENEWRKVISRETCLRADVPVDLRKITDLAGAVDYIAKYSHTEAEFIHHLPTGI